MFTCTVKGVCLVLYMCTSSCWSLFLVQFKSQVTFLLVAKVRVRVSQSSLAFERTEEGASPRGGPFRGCCWWSAWVGRSPSFQLEMLLHLCPFAGRWCFCLRPAVRLRSLFCSLGPSCTHKTHTHLSVHSVIPQRWNETFFCLSNFPQSDQFELTCGTSWGLLCSTHRSLSQPSYPGPSGSSGQQPGPCLKTRNNLTWVEPTPNIRTRSVLFTASHPFTYTAKTLLLWVLLVGLLSKRSTVWNISVLVIPYFSAACRNREICSICLKAMPDFLMDLIGLLDE